MSTRAERLTFGHGIRLAVPPPPSRVAAALAHEPEPVRLTRVSTWDWGWGGLLIFTVLLFFRPQDQIPGFGNSHVSDIAAIIGLSAMSFINLSRGRPVTRVTPELLGVAALGGVILLTAPMSIWPGGSIRVFTDLFLTVALIFMLMVNTMTSPRRIEQIGRIIVLAFGYMCVRVIFDYARGVNLMEGGRASGPVGGFFQNPNDLALNLVSFLPIALMYVKRPGPMLKRLMYAGVSVLMLTAAILTKSRGGMLGAVAMLVTFLVVSRSLKPATIIAIVFSGLLLSPVLPQSFWDRMASITVDNPADGSREERKMLFRRGWGIFLENPLTGVGAGQFRNYISPAWPHLDRETHNVLLQVAAEIGILGVAAFLFLIVRAFGAAWWTRRQLSWIYRRRRRPRDAADADPPDGLDESERLFLQTHGAAMVAGLVGWFVTAFFLSVTYNWTIYYLLGLAVSARDVVRHRADAFAEAKRRQQSREVTA